MTSKSHSKWTIPGFDAPKSAPSPLARFGWRPAFANQIDPDTEADLRPARVVGVHRNGLDVVGPDLATRIPPYRADEEDDETAATVGDWLLLDADATRAVRALDRQSLLKRRAPGTGRQVQLIAANVDTVFIVTSCNRDFNLARLERYLALVRSSGVLPVVVITKADLVDDTASYVKEARALLPNLSVEAVNALEPGVADMLRPWCGPGQTVAFMGSSGVGKSTLVNTLLGEAAVETKAAREDDDRGRHTTTARALHRLAHGGWLLDTPGMRELQMTDVEDGLDELYADIEELSAGCRFSDCAHDQEPGCAVTAALANGQLDAARVKRWKKLVAENRFNAMTLAERRAAEKGFGKMIREVQSIKKKR